MNVFKALGFFQFLRDTTVIGISELKHSVHGNVIYALLNLEDLYHLHTIYLLYSKVDKDSICNLSS